MKHRIKNSWIPDLPDFRDHLFEFAKPIPLPASVDLREHLPPVWEQGNLGCHDDKTEVLTNKGWKMWPDITGEELLGTVHPATHELQFQLPSALQRYEYDGLLYHADHRSLDFAITPNHRIYSRRWNAKLRTLDRHFEFREIQDVGWYAGLLSAPSGSSGLELKKLQIGNRDYTGDDLLSLIALVASDGWVGGSLGNLNSVSFCCYREDRLSFVNEFASRLGLHPIPGRQNVWKWSDAALATWLRENLFVGERYRSPFKRIPDIVKCANPRQIDLFLKFFGDQHIQEDGSRAFYSSSRTLISDLQELLLRVGKRGSIYERSPRSVQMHDGRRIEAENCIADITLCERKTDRLSIEKRQLEKEHYKGEVFCATVPNSTLITRRNGSILISGNSCTSFALTAAFDFERARQKLPFLNPSKLFLYYNEREREGTVNEDAGAMLRNGIKSLVKQGTCPETEWPYDINQFAVKPPADCYTSGLKNQVLSYRRIQPNLRSMLYCLAYGFPFVFGFSVYDSFESDVVATTGMVPMPGLDETQLGGHAVLAVGYHQNTRCFLVRNSWGLDWGTDGYFWMPYDYVANPDLADDRWQIKMVEQPV